MLLYQIFDVTGKEIGRTSDQGEAQAFIAAHPGSSAKAEEDPTEFGLTRLPRLDGNPPTPPGDLLTQ